jgi:hypothetical protein
MGADMCVCRPPSGHCRNACALGPFKSGTTKQMGARSRSWGASYALCSALSALLGGGLCGFILNAEVAVFPIRVPLNACLLRSQPQVVRRYVAPKWPLMPQDLPDDSAVQGTRPPCVMPWMGFGRGAHAAVSCSAIIMPLRHALVCVQPSLFICSCTHTHAARNFSAERRLKSRVCTTTCLRSAGVPGTHPPLAGLGRSPVSFVVWAFACAPLRARVWVWVSFIYMVQSTSKRPMIAVHALTRVSECVR